jgi:Uma2 family endonuclease
MVLFDPRLHWPTSTELPDSDDTPVDNELQNLIPNLLLLMLSDLWAERDDWFFGVDMGIYYLPNQHRQPLIPDGFLSVGVPRRKNPPRGRLSYVLWEESNIVPSLALECVSQSYGGEYDQKAEKYVSLGVRYYVIYNPDHSQRDGHEPLEVYELQGGYYERLFGEPVWLEALGIGIGRAEALHKGWQREWLFWYSEAGRTLTPDEQLELERQRVELERQRADALAAKLRSLGFEPNDL